MLFLYDLFFISGFSAKDALKRHYKLYLPVVLSLGYFAFIVLSNTYDRSADYPGIGVKPHDYVITQFNAHWTYLRLLVFPAGQNADYDYPISRTLFELPTLISFVGYLVLWVAGIVLAKKRPVAAFGVLWFLVTLVPISFAVAFMGLRLGNVIFEHRAYLPSAGAIAAAVCGIVFLTERSEKLRIAAVSAVVALSLVLSVAAYKRNEVWRSDVSLWEDVVKKSPEKDRGHYNLGLAYQNRKMLEEAIEQYEAAIKIRPGHTKAHNNLGMVLKNMGFTDRALEHYKIALEFAPDNAEVHNNLGNIYDEEGMAKIAIEHYKTAVRLKPDYAVAHYNLGIAYYRQGMTDEARREFQRVLEINPRFHQAGLALKQLD
jgi:tetratricopeptide (TPR) repeat protein